MEAGTRSALYLNSSESGMLGAAIRRVVNRQSWLWLAGLLLLLLLAIDIASFGVPHLAVAEWQSEAHRLSANRIINGFRLLFGVFIIYQLYLHQKSINALAEELGRFGGKDSVTGFYSRQLGEQRLLEEIARATRRPRPLIIVRTTLVGLHAVDQRMGRASVDGFIRMFAERVQQKLRRCDIPVRLERGEFLLVLPECKTSAVGVVLGRLNEMTLDIGAKYQIPVATGWADFSAGDSLQELTMRAERMLLANQENQKGELGASGSIPRSPHPRFANLTAREREVFELLAQGKTNKEIANVLNISVNTVETHRGRIMNQLDVHSAAELVLFAVNNGLLPHG